MQSKKNCQSEPYTAHPPRSEPSVPSSPFCGLTCDEKKHEEKRRRVLRSYKHKRSGYRGVVDGRH